jgi:hypothetical protein
MAPESEDNKPNKQEVVLQDIIDHYTSKVGEDEPDDDEPDEDDEPTPLPSLNEAH